jgi:MFS family permease
VFLSRAGYLTTAVATFAAATNFSGLAVQAPVGFLSDRLGRRPVAMSVLVSSCAASVLMGLGASSIFPVILGIGCLFAACTAPLYGLGSSRVNDRLQPGQALAATSGLLFAWSIGSTFGPSVAGAMMGRLGPSGLFVYLSAVLAIISVFVCARMLRRGEVPRAQRTSFVPGPAAAPAHLAELAAHGGRPADPELPLQAEAVS